MTHTDAFQALTPLFGKQGRWDEAEQVEREVMEINEAKRGVDHPDTLDSIARVILILKEPRRGDESAKLYLQGQGSLVSGLKSDGLWDMGEKLMIQQVGERRVKSLLDVI